MKEKVSIIIPAWNGFAYTQNCLRYINKYTDFPHELILINNGSRDGTAWLFEQHREAKVITNPANIGRPGAYNQGIRNSGGEYILLLHNDVVVTPNWLSKLVNCLKLNPGAGMAGPRTSNAPVTGDKTLNFQGFKDIFAHAAEYSLPDPAKWYEVTQWLPGFCLLIRAEVIQQVGLLDEQFKYGLFDDMDYSRRVRGAGYKLICAGDTFVHHFGGRTFAENNLDIQEISGKYRRLYQAKWNPGPAPGPPDTSPPAGAPGITGPPPDPAQTIAMALTLPPAVKSSCGPEASIIIPCCNEGDNIKMTVNSIITTKSAIPYEIIVVDDGSTDGCCDFLRNEQNKQWEGIKLITTPGVGAANARNLGAIAASGNNYIFCDGHILVESQWLEKLSASLDTPGVDVVAPGIGDAGNPGGDTGYGQTWNEKLVTGWFKEKPPGMKEIPLAPGGCLAVRAAAFREVGGFEKGFRVWGFEDVELSLKLWLFGFKIYVNPDVRVLHVFKTSHTYLIRDEDYHYNYLRMALSHFSRNRVEKALAGAIKLPNIHSTLTDLMLSDIWDQRREYLARRKYDDDWFMKKFNIPY